jgi:hypothetical protein
MVYDVESGPTTWETRPRVPLNPRLFSSPEILVSIIGWGSFSSLPVYAVSAVSFTVLEA